MKQPEHILVIRFSALGDVAMTVPVVRLLLAQHPSLHVTFLSDPFMAPLFDGIERLRFIGADTRKVYKGLAGLRRLSRQLATSKHFDAVADLHNVLRTKIIRLFLPAGSKAAIDKGRAEKKELTRPVNKKLRQLKTGFQRYADVFTKIGLPVDLAAGDGFAARYPSGQNHKTIGIAPFARHLPKMYPLDLMHQAAIQLADDGVQVLLFGSGAEADRLQQWEQHNIRSLAGKVSFREELKIIGTLDAMVSMDSANMHLASMNGVPVVSLWGGTHPFLGFYGWHQPMENALQVDFSCRPSSVFGNKPCPVHGEQGCMQGITPAMIRDKVLGVLA